MGIPNYGSNKAGGALGWLKNYDAVKEYNDTQFSEDVSSCVKVNSAQSLESALFLRVENNKISLNSAIINFNDNSILGKDIEIDFYNSSSGTMKNEPRMKARSAFIYNQNTKLNKVVYKHGKT